MKIIKIHFTRNKNGAIFSKLLQWYEKVNFSHVCVELESKSFLKTNIIFHSSISGGVTLLNKEIFLNSNEIMHTYNIYATSEERLQLLRSAVKQCGTSYGFLQNLGILMVDTAKHLGIKIKNPFTEGQNCSEFIYRNIISKIYDHNSKDPNLVKPSEIKEILEITN